MTAGPRTRPGLWLWLFGFGGLTAAAISTYVHSQLLTDPSYTSFCDVSATFSCASAYLSEYGSVRGVPVALLGVAWFGVTLLLLGSWRFGATSLRTSAPAYLFAWSTMGLAVVLYLAYASLFLLKSLCLLCIATYVAVTGLFVLSGSASSDVPMTSLPRRAFHDLRLLLKSPVALTTLAVFVIAVGSVLASFPRHDAGSAAAGGRTPPPPLEPQQQTEVERWFDNEPRQIVPVDGQGATVLVVKFNDYQCPPCRTTFEQYKSIWDKYEREAPGRVKFVTKDFPLDPECNSNAPGGQHTAACEAAVAVRLAREHNKAEQLENWLFANQPSLTPSSVRQGAREIAGVTDFDARYATLVEQVKADVALGGLLGVRSTPTFFINGVRVVGGLQPQFMDAVIAHELKKAAK